jgi:hypothetical protein
MTQKNAATDKSSHRLECKLEKRKEKKRQTQVCCLNILLILSVKNGDVVRSNSLGLIWGMEFAS